MALSNLNSWLLEVCERNASRKIFSDARHHLVNYNLFGNVLTQYLQRNLIHPQTLGSCPYIDHSMLPGHSCESAGKSARARQDMASQKEVA